MPRFPATRRLGGAAPEMASRPLDGPMLAGYDAVLLVTPHRAIGLDLVRRHAYLVVDTRGALRRRCGNADGAAQAEEGAEIIQA